MSIQRVMRQMQWVSTGAAAVFCATGSVLCINGLSLQVFGVGSQTLQLAALKAARPLAAMLPRSAVLSTFAPAGWIAFPSTGILIAASLLTLFLVATYDLYKHANPPPSLGQRVKRFFVG